MAFNKRPVRLEGSEILMGFDQIARIKRHPDNVQAVANLGDAGQFLQFSAE